MSKVVGSARASTDSPPATKARGSHRCATSPQSSDLDDAPCSEVSVGQHVRISTANVTEGPSATDACVSDQYHTRRPQRFRVRVRRIMSGCAVAVQTITGGWPRSPVPYNTAWLPTRYPSRSAAPTAVSPRCSVLASRHRVRRIARRSVQRPRRALAFASAGARVSTLRARWPRYSRP